MMSIAVPKSTELLLQHVDNSVAEEHETAGSYGADKDVGSVGLEIIKHWSSPAQKARCSDLRSAAPATDPDWLQPL